MSQVIDELEVSRRKGKMRAFLEGFRMNGIVLAGCRVSGVSRRSINYWMTHSAENPSDENYCLPDEHGVMVPFHEWVRLAGEAAADAAEEECYRRAVSGVDEDVFYQGVKVATIKRRSDLLLIFLLKRLKPEFRDNFKMEVAHTGTINIDSARRRLAEKLEAVLERSVIDVTPAPLAIEGVKDEDHD